MFLRFLINQEQDKDAASLPLLRAAPELLVEWSPLHVVDQENMGVKIE